MAKQTYEYQYNKTETGAFGVDYIEADSVTEAQRKLTEVSKGGDTEVINPRRVK